MFFSVYTLGCKLNQLETEAITDSFRREGFSLFSPEDSGHNEPSILIINTCTVTSMAEQKARRIIRKSLADYPRACIIVTGCYAQMERAALEALDTGAELRKRIFVIPGEEKDRLLDLPRFLGAARPGVGSELSALVADWLASRPAEMITDSAAHDERSFRFRPENFSAHSRAFLKIQDGCDHSCAYCRVSIARGRSRSLGAAKVLEELRSLELKGFSEVVLTGVNITQYTDSGLKRPGLSGLLEFLLGETEKIRIRLSSVEPDGLSEAFYDILANSRIRPHLHLSLQSGSGAVLAKMGRSYTPAGIVTAIARIRSVRNDPFLACDIIAGFPGETEAEFQKTLELCESIGFAWIHAFPFSRRPGTAAYHFPQTVSEREAAGRVAQLTELARKSRREYIRRWEGKEVEAVAEKGKGKRKGCVPGVSENYLKLLIAYDGEKAPDPGSLVRCRIIHGCEIPGFDAFGEILP